MLNYFHMIIGVDATRANRPKKTGVEWYSYHMIQHLKRLPESQEHSWLMYTNDPLTHGLEQGPSAWHETRLRWPPKYLWTQLRLSWEIMRHAPDVLYVSSHVLPRIAPKKSVVVIHDIGFHTHPELYKPRQIPYHEWSTRDIVKRASKIIVVSEFSKHELMQHYGASENQLHVVYPGIQHDRYHRLPEDEVSRIITPLQIHRPFFMYIGRIDRKKNVLNAIKAFEIFKSKRGEGDPYSLVLVGQPGYRFNDVQHAMQTSAYADSMQYVGYATEEEKIAMLSCASGLVHPSWYEGFGFTPIEAMACECPVLCSRVGSLPEVVGKHHVLWFDPANPYDMANQFSHALDSAAELKEKITSAREWCQKYTWESAAKKTYKLLTDWS